MGMTGFHILEIHFINFPVPWVNYNIDYKSVVPIVSHTQLWKMSGSWTPYLLSGFLEAVSPAVLGQDPLIPLVCLHSGPPSPLASRADSFLRVLVPASGAFCPWGLMV